MEFKTKEGTSMSEGKVVKQTKKPITRKSFADELRLLGVAKGMTVIVHSSLSSLGWVCGGPVTIIQALQNVLTTEGTLVMPAHTSNVSDPEEWENPAIPESWWKVVREEMPAFDPSITPTYFMGHIAETFRSLPDVKRSNHPRYSFAAWGKHRDRIIDNHSLDYGMGNKSPLGALYQLDGHVIMIGTGYGQNTSMHLGEHQAEVYGTLVKGSPVLENGERVWKTFLDLDYDDDQFEAIGKAFENHHHVKKRTIGNAPVRLMKQRDIVHFTSSMIRKRELD